MKVTSTSSTGSTAGSGGAKPAAEGFSLGMGGVGGPSRASGVAGTAGVAGVSSLLALQGLGGPEEAKQRALRKGRRLLDALDRLQVAMLDGGPKASHVGLLSRALAEQRDPSGDQGLDDVLNWAEVRAAVEVAKLQRAG